MSKVKISDYFAYTSERRAQSRRDSSSACSPILRDVMYGEHIRRIKMNMKKFRHENVERAAAKSAMWCIWKEKQTGKAVNGIQSRNMRGQ